MRAIRINRVFLAPVVVLTAMLPTPRLSLLAGTPTRWTLPAAAKVVIRTTEAIDSATATEGQTYGATIVQNIADGAGRVIVPEGSRARLVIRKLTSGGVTGRPTLALDLQSFQTDGRRYIVNPQKTSEPGKSRSGPEKSTATWAGGPALGTLLEAIGAGAKGPPAGSLEGAKPPGAAQVVTRGRQIKIPADVTLTFRLDQPLELQLAP